ncbi:hypothetical protein [Pyramidobacter piscolens]|uniref:hypothetical protein n=1 Tax=Pyramidobacter piscolens TaxID=638849 RepID=UPI001FCBC987|nr:hypothetical protein [Pyramidobacter piscolens]BDF78354.1 hypothetical protein CE91St28_11480 [Pyramidobacter piscolens]
MRTGLEKLTLRLPSVAHDSIPVSIACLTRNDKALSAYVIELEHYCDDLLRRIQQLENRLEEKDLEKEVEAAAERN